MDIKEDIEALLDRKDLSSKLNVNHEFIA